MLKIVYPNFDFKLKQDNNRDFIFDEVRRQWVRLTPEEWVRQNFIQYLLQVKKYPASLIAVEKEIKLHELSKRCDIIVYKFDKPWMIVECKSTDIIMNEAIIKQILQYNMALPVSMLIVTNGHYAAGFERHDEMVSLLDEIPLWKN
jgi:hypothetical protein